MELQIKALSPRIGGDIPLPYFATDGAAAMDLHACLDEPLSLAPGERKMVPSGIAVAIPDGHVGIIAIRSSMGAKHGINMANGIGVIDSDYRGPLSMCIVNLSDTPYTIEPGDRVAQLMVLPVVQPTLKLVEELPETQRGQGGFGSTGK